MPILHCVRHGESDANAGAIINDDRSVKLTAKGLEQAQKVAESWQEKPDRIIASNFVRAQQTAKATCERFPGVPYEIWDVIGEHELFCFVEWKEGCTRPQRQEYFWSYLKEGNPDVSHGETAETFGEFEQRIRKALLEFSKLPDNENVFIFSHSMFLVGMLLILEDPKLTGRALMQTFHRNYLASAHPIPNGAVLKMVNEGETWEVLERSDIAVSAKLA